VGGRGRSGWEPGRAKGVVWNGRRFSGNAMRGTLESKRWRFAMKASINPRTRGERPRHLLSNKRKGGSEPLDDAELMSFIVDPFVVKKKGQTNEFRDGNMTMKQLVILAVITVAALAGGTVIANAQVVVERGLPSNAPAPHAGPEGQYQVTNGTDPSLPTHTIYRPADLNALGEQKLPIVAWGNGGCINSGRSAEKFLNAIAAHGFFIVAIGPDNVPPPDLSGLKPGEPLPPLPPEMVTKSSQLIDGINWAISENSRADSPYYGKLDTNAIAVMGGSCGGMQAIAVSGDPRVKTSIIWNSGVLTVDQRPGRPGMYLPAVKDDLKKFHAPVAYFIGGPKDVAYKASEDDFKLIDGVPLFNANLNVGHGGTGDQPNGGWWGEVGVAWLSWQLKGDKGAAKMFEGENCGLCVEPDWTVKKKNMK